MPLVDVDAFFENHLREKFIFGTGKDLRLPLKTELKENYVYVTVMGVLEARGAWGYTLFQNTKLRTMSFCECWISAFSKQSEQSYTMSDLTEDEPVLINVDKSVLQKIFTALIRPLQNRAMKLKMILESFARQKPADSPSPDDTEYGDPPF
jgi:hypothetical protein